MIEKYIPKIYRDNLTLKNIFKALEDYVKNNVYSIFLDKDVDFALKDFFEVNFKFEDTFFKKNDLIKESILKNLFYLKRNSFSSNSFKRLFSIFKIISNVSYSIRSDNINLEKFLRVSDGSLPNNTILNQFTYSKIDTSEQFFYYLFNEKANQFDLDVSEDFTFDSFNDLYKQFFFDSDLFSYIMVSSVIFFNTLEFLCTKSKYNDYHNTFLDALDLNFIFNLSDKITPLTTTMITSYKFSYTVNGYGVRTYFSYDKIPVPDYNKSFIYIFANDYRNRLTDENNEVYVKVGRDGFYDLETVNYLNNLIQNESFNFDIFSDSSELFFYKSLFYTEDIGSNGLRLYNLFTPVYYFSNVIPEEILDTYAPNLKGHLYKLDINLFFKPSISELYFYDSNGPILYLGIPKLYSDVFSLPHLTLEILEDSTYTYPLDSSISFYRISNFSNYDNTFFDGINENSICFSNNVIYTLNQNGYLYSIDILNNTFSQYNIGIKDAHIYYHNNSIYIFGGYFVSTNQFTESIYKFDFSNLTFITNYYQEKFSSYKVDDQIYLFFGINTQSSSFNNLVLYKFNLNLETLNLDYFYSSDTYVSIENGTFILKENYFYLFFYNYYYKNINNVVVYSTHNNRYLNISREISPPLQYSFNFQSFRLFKNSTDFFYMNNKYVCKNEEVLIKFYNSNSFPVGIQDGNKLYILYRDHLIIKEL